jgi:TolA-binding protein
MLQIALRALLCVGLVSGAMPAWAGVIPQGGDSLPVEWLLQCGAEDELMQLSQTAVVLPADVLFAVNRYRDGEYRFAAEDLEKLRDLNLPDGRMDFILFALGESYRKLGCRGLAAEEYHVVIDNYSASDKVPSGFYRLLEFAVTDDEQKTADSLYSVFCQRFADHPLINAVRYLGALNDYKHGEYVRALVKLSQIPATSTVLARTRFLSALCRIQTKEYGEALATLTELRKSGVHGEIDYETSILLGDIFYLRNNPAEALTYYRKVPETAKRYKYVEVQTAQCYFDLGNYRRSAKLAMLFLEKNPANSYYFEIASVLEESYRRLGDQSNLAQVSLLIRREIVNAQLTIEIFDEIDRVADMLSSWQGIEYRVLREGRSGMHGDVDANMRKLQDLESRYYALLREVAPEISQGGGPGSGFPYQSERRYLSMLKTREDLYNDTIADLQKRIVSAGMLLSPPFPDTNAELKATTDSLQVTIDSLRNRRDQCNHEYATVMKECIGKEYKNREGDEELQAKFVDWVFAKYLETKAELQKASEQIAARKKAAGKAVIAAKEAGTKPEVSPEKAKPALREPEKQYTEADRTQLIQMIASDREGLISHLKTSLEVYPKSKYNAKILFRLAELYFDAADDDFQVALTAYEQQLAQRKDTAGMAFPEYHLEKVLATYDDIILHYPNDDVIEDAVFYKAVALDKWGKEDEANSVLLSLIEKYPQSQFFVEANMRIGKYYFDHPKVENGRGYALAEDAYRRVLFFRDHPQYYAALYQLGWCYYMQNQYENAIAVFKYFIEGSHPDFALARRDENQVKNPLLREEAVDYIAVCYDILGKMEDAVSFLKLTNSPDYSAMVVKRMGELREEDLDYPGAIRAYKRLLAEYPNTPDAPQSYVSLIRLYDSHKNTDSAMLLREDFLARYGRGGEWQKQLGGDTVLRNSVDSMAIANGLYVADASYRRADSTKNEIEYGRAARNYEHLIESYPEDLHAAEALWNLAVILDQKLHDKEKAFIRYTAYSKLPRVDSTRREQAAVNAFAISQELMAPDSLVKKGEIEPAALRVIDAVQNYCTNFPHGASWSKVMLGLGAVYFNRHLLADAEKTYEAIELHGQTGPEYFEALFFLGQCRYAEENWQTAALAFEKVWKSSGDEALRAAAKKLLVQCDFLYAKKIDSSGNAEKAAALYSSIDDTFPGSEYGDVVLFNAAEAMEKTGKLDGACERYAMLVKRYPASKLAPGALFNAAGDFEKSQKFDLAAATYERILREYGSSDKAKDALFNVGFCYEKLGQLDKMAEVNEQYTDKYPGEKNVELMLLRSAAYYSKAGQQDKAIEAYRNFIIRYPRNPRAVEANFMLAKCYYDKGYAENALIGFAQTEQANADLQKLNIPADDYHAGEAAYYAGIIKRDKFHALTFAGSSDELERTLREKSVLLADAENSFKQVMAYRSPRIFEAACCIGQMYEELAVTWKNQLQPPLDPIKAAVLNRDILTASSQLLQKSFVPFAKVPSIARAFDSLSAEQKGWIAKSDSALRKNLLMAGAWLWSAAGVLQDAPIPAEIREKPVHFYQYREKLLETVLPLKRTGRDYFIGALSLADSLKLKGPEIDSCRTMFAFENFSIGDEYDRLNVEILAKTKELGADLSKEEKENIVFQLQDISYELQDKAIQLHEEGLAFAHKHALDTESWSHKILESLARLNPTKYGRAFYQSVTASSDSSWIVRPDSAAGWNSIKPPLDGWQAAAVVSAAAEKHLADAHAFILKGAGPAGPAFFWKSLYLAGAPRSAEVRVLTRNRYRLFVNGVLILSDTSGKVTQPAFPDSAIGITATLRGGDNWMAIETNAADSTGIRTAVALNAMVDTTEHFAPSAVVIPHVVFTQSAAPAPTTPKLDSSAAALPPPEPLPVIVPQSSLPPAPEDTVTVPKTRKELARVMAHFQAREAQAQEDAVKEQLAIDRLKAERDSVDAQLLLINMPADKKSGAVQK